MAEKEYQAFKRRTKVHNNERLRFRTTLIPFTGETIDFSTWSFSAPTLKSNGEKVFGAISVDAAAGTVIVDADPGPDPGRCQVDLLTDFGTGGSSWMRLGSVFARVRAGSGSHA